MIPPIDAPVYVQHGRKGFLPGNPGRPPQALTRTARFCDEIGFDWRIEAVKRFRDKSIPQASRDFALKLIVERCEPTLKAIEVMVDKSNQSPVLINIVSGKEPLDATIIDTVDPMVAADASDAAVNINHPYYDDQAEMAAFESIIGEMIDDTDES